MKFAIKKIYYKVKKKGLKKSFKIVLEKSFLPFFRKWETYLLEYTTCPEDLHLSDQALIQIREIMPNEIHLVNQSIRQSDSIWMKRWGSGAKCFGVLYHSKVIEYCWACFTNLYQDPTDKFSIHLNPGECFLFDYVSDKEKPFELGRFRLMKDMIHFGYQYMKSEFPTEEIKFLTLVQKKNRVSLYFHEKMVYAKVIANVSLYRFLWIKWFNREDVEESYFLRLENSR